MKVSASAPRATPRRVISASPRVTSAARALRPRAHAVGDAGGDREHVLDRAADLDADRIGRGVDAQARVMEGGDGGGAHAGVAARGDERGRLAARDLDREARPGQHADARRRRHRARDLVAERAGRVLEALAEPEHGRVEAGRQAREQRLEPGHRRRDDDDASFAVAERRAEIGADLQRRRQHDLRQVARVAAHRAQLRRLLGVARPEPRRVRRRGVDGERGAPRACAEHRDVHRVCASRLRRAAVAPRVS